MKKKIVFEYESNFSHAGCNYLRRSSEVLPGSTTQCIYMVASGPKKLMLYTLFTDWYGESLKFEIIFLKFKAYLRTTKHKTCLFVLILMHSHAKFKYGKENLNLIFLNTWIILACRLHSTLAWKVLRGGICSSCHYTGGELLYLPMSQQPSCLYVWWWVILPPDFFITKPSKYFCQVWVTFLVWTYIAHEFRLSRGKIRDNDVPNNHAKSVGTITHLLMW